MSEKKYEMPGEDHIQQFHNYDHHPEPHDSTRTMWWEMGEAPRPEGFASGGSVISQLRKRPSEMMRIHPALNIPGVHIRTAEAGEPFFHGDK